MSTEVVKITDLARGGSGVGRLKDESDSSNAAGGRVIFVPYTLAGDVVRVRLIESKKRYTHAELIEVIEPSPERVSPPCKVFGRCGGCDWQHVPYETQWKTKLNGALQALARFDIVIDKKEEFPAENPWNYRNRIQLRGSGNNLGFFGSKTHNVIAVDSCEIARQEINQVWEETREEGVQLGKPYKVEIEVLHDGKVRKTWNSPHGSAGFRQINDDQNESLKEWVARSFDQPLNRDKILYDLFGGSGNLSQGLASKVKAIHCVDVSCPRVAPAGTPPHFQFHSSSVKVWLNQQTKVRDGHSCAIIDPPREGLGEDFESIADGLEKLRVDRLIAVGCDPDSWARDVSKLLKRNWNFERAAFFDFFPQTPHIESAAYLSRVFA